jgi:hypothetical protein
MKFNYIFLLLGLIIFSCIIFFIFSTKEGYSNNSDDSDLFGSVSQDIPGSPGCENLDSNVPPCYNTIKKNYNDFTSDFLKDDKYILKTQIVTPTCPSNPYTPFNLTDSKTDTTIDYDSSYNQLVADFLKSYSTRELSNNLQPRDGSFNVYNNITNTTYKTQTISPGAEPKIDPTSISNWTLTNPLTTNANNTPSEDSQFKNETPEAVSNVSNSKSQPSTIEESNSSCPPCPSCERCPDPIVECKRVINYRNPNAMSNIPVPVIDDFSNFTK